MDGNCLRKHAHPHSEPEGGKLQNPVELDIGRYIIGRAAPIHCIRWTGDRRPLRVTVLPRPRRHVHCCPPSLESAAGQIASCVGPMQSPPPVGSAPIPGALRLVSASLYEGGKASTQLISKGWGECCFSDCQLLSLGAGPEVDCSCAANPIQRRHTAEIGLRWR